MSNIVLPDDFCVSPPQVWQLPNMALVATTNF